MNLCMTRFATALLAVLAVPAPAVKRSAALLIGAGLVAALPITAAEESTTSAETELEARLPIRELREFAEAFNRISKAYVEEIDDKELLDNAIRGMLAQLDPHSVYLDNDRLSDLNESTSGNYGGLGLEVDMQDGAIRVVSPMDETPASRAGMMAGDLIIRLDDRPVKGMNLSESIEIMRGPPGSEVVLTIIRHSDPEPLVLTLVREIIQLASVRERLLDDGYGYIRIAQFQNRTGPDVKKSLDKLTEEGKLDGLVLDLRNNPGGVLQAAVDVSNIFLDSGLIVYTEGRLPNTDLRYNATSNDSVNGIPIVVLVNSGTASASEIVAGALQDHQRAVIMGTTTFGKGSVQTIIPLSNQNAIKLTTSRYFTPNGRSIQAEGIVPDVWVGRSRVTLLDANPFRLKEKDLRKHLSANNDSTNNDETDADAPGVPEVIVPDQPTEDLAVTDYQLNEALTLLRGINVLQTNRG
jgi:carboxyl-terminal processing protease